MEHKTAAPGCTKLWIFFICSRYSSFDHVPVFRTACLPHRLAQSRFLPRHLEGKMLLPGFYLLLEVPRQNSHPVCGSDAFCFWRWKIHLEANVFFSSCLGFFCLVKCLRAIILQAWKCSTCELPPHFLKSCYNRDFQHIIFKTQPQVFLALTINRGSFWRMQKEAGVVMDGAQRNDIYIPPSPDLLPMPYRSPPYANKLILYDFAAGVPTPFPCPALTCRSPAASETLLRPSRVAQPLLVIHSTAKQNLVLDIFTYRITRRRFGERC